MEIKKSSLSCDRGTLVGDNKGCNVENVCTADGCDKMMNHDKGRV